MRVTNNWLMASTMRNLNRLRADAMKGEQQVSSGLAFTKMSENVVGGNEVLKLQHRLGQLEMWKEHQADTAQWLVSSEATLNDMSESITRLNELAVQARTGSAEGNRAHIATEVREIGEHLLGLLNGRNGDKALFGGFQTQGDPFTMDWTTGTLTYGGDSGKMLRDVGPNTNLIANISGDQLSFTYVDASGATQTGDMVNTVFRLLQDMIPTTVTPGAPPDYPPQVDTVARLSAAFDQISALRTQVGVSYQRFTQSESKLQDTYVYLQSAMEATQGADPAKAILELEQTNSAYRAALEVSGRMLPVTLADFLR